MMRHADAWVFGFCCACGVFGLGWITHEWAEDQAPRIEIRRIVLPVTPAQILTCPVTKFTIEEYERDCRARKYSDSIKPKGKK